MTQARRESREDGAQMGHFLCDTAKGTPGVMETSLRTGLAHSIHPICVSVPRFGPCQTFQGTIACPQPWQEEIRFRSWWLQLNSLGLEGEAEQDKVCVGGGGQVGRGPRSQQGGGFLEWGRGA